MTFPKDKNSKNVNGIYDTKLFIFSIIYHMKEGPWKSSEAPKLKQVVGSWTLSGT